MSTSVLPTEYASLIMVPEENWGYRWGSGGKESYVRANLGKCDVEPAHGTGVIYMQTPDHRGIVLCGGCHSTVKQAQEAAGA